MSEGGIAEIIINEKKIIIKELKKLMNYAYHEMMKGIFLIARRSGVMEGEGEKITTDGKNTVITCSDAGEGNSEFNVWWDYSPEQCCRYLFC
ncbi:hypothetical protein ACLH9T_004861 [Salmonella enterica]|nr:hypothetical protein [Salmonella enterica]EEH5174105.1 hypothetical protein [Salmonella enterica]